MTIERYVWERFERELTCAVAAKTQRSRLQVLASIRPLIVNPSTTIETISGVVETLVQCLQQDNELLHHHLLNLLSDVACKGNASQIIFDTVLAYVTARKDASQLTAQALAVLVAIAEQNQSSSFISAVHELNEDFFLLLCFSSSVSVRSWMLLNAGKFNVRPSLLATVMVELTKDHYPYVRRAALSGLVDISELVDGKESNLIEGCYDRAVNLLLDSDESVRSAAVNVVGKWGHMLATSSNDVGTKDWSDAVFVQLSSMARDMSVEVRTEAFSALGKTKLVSEDILLQTLSKKIMGGIKGRTVIGQCTTKELDIPASNVAGIFVHGFEDEFYEVRKSACKSLGMLTMFSIRFANDSLSLLSDLLNDDNMVVRLQCLESMYYMATCDRLNLKGLDMHMFLGSLVDASILIRCAARNALRLMKLMNLEIFKSSISGLLTNLESYPEDEADIFFVLFSVGRGHGNFAVSFVREVSQEIEPSCEGELSLDKARVAAMLVLAIAAVHSTEHRRFSIPTRLYTYAIPFLGRISRSLTSVLSQDTLLAYLSHVNKFSDLPRIESFRKDDNHMTLVEEGTPYHNTNNTHVVPLHQISYGTSENQFQGNCWDSRDRDSVKKSQQESTSMYEEATNTVGFILETVAETWSLIKSGCTDEVQRTLRSCKNELTTIAVDLHGSVSILAFASQYIRVIKLLTKVWNHILPSRKFHGNGTGAFEIFLEKVETNLKQIRYAYLGFSNEEELHILEIVLLISVLRLSKAELCSHLTILKRLRATISRVEFLCEKGYAELSDFAVGLKKIFEEGSDYEASCPFPFKRLLESFSLKRFVFSGRFKHISAELDVQGNNSENPLPFISGLPVGITFQITLHNAPDKDRIWLKMAVEEHTQYVFLDLNQFENSDDIKKWTLSVPFYRTPKAASFLLRASITKECPSEDVYVAKGHGGPKHELAVLCNEKDVYLVIRS